MRRDDILLIYIHRMGSSLSYGDVSDIRDADLSAVTGIEVSLASRLSPEALILALADMTPERRFLVGLCLAQKAFLLGGEELAEKAATVLMAAAEENQDLEGPWLVSILQNLFGMRAAS